MACRSGLAAVNQSVNVQAQRRQMVLNQRNSFYDKNMSRVSITNVQQVSDRAFYLRNGRWTDSRLVNDASRTKPARVIEFGSNEFRELAYQLAQSGRQGSISLRGDVLLLVDNQPVLIRGPHRNTENEALSSK